MRRVVQLLLILFSVRPAFGADTDVAALLPPAAVGPSALSSNDHPLAGRINTFLARQSASTNYSPTGFTKADYLRIIGGQVAAMRRYQDVGGRIIDPVRKEECYFATPCYAHGVAALVAGTPGGGETDLLESGAGAMDAATADMAAGKAAGGHGDFYTYPVMLALDLYEGRVPAARWAQWTNRLAKIDRAKLYRVRTDANNWNIVNLSGDFLRAARGLASADYAESCLAAQLKHFTPLGMFNEAGNPLAYDHFSRHYLAGVLHQGYRGASFAAYRDLLWRAAWVSLFMQSPFGELPTGYRSSHHIWNEAEQAVTFELYAMHYARAGRPAEAGAFKRAAHLSLESVTNWIRTDGSGYIVKNRYPIEAKHGYETYSTHTAYNLLACSMLAQAWQFADDAVAERPAPADVGGFVVPILEPFHKIFANAGGTYVEYDTSGDHKYNPTGLIRVHLRGGHPQLGPSDGCAPLFSGRDVNIAVGPSWKTAGGGWQSLASLNPPAPAIDILSQEPTRAAFRLTFDRLAGGTGPVVKLVTTVAVEPGVVSVEDVVSGDVEAVRATWPMLVFDGAERTRVEMSGNAITACLGERGVRFSVIDPKGAVLQRGGRMLVHRNGEIDPVFGEVDGGKIRYEIRCADRK